jgi:hypothetical protein
MSELNSIKEGPYKVAKAKIKEEMLPDDVIVQQNLPKLFKTYPNLNLHHPSSWFVWNAEGKVLPRLTEICHAKMCTDGAGWDDLITAVPKSDPVSIAYLRMLINGPFKSFSDLIALKHVSHKSKIKDMEKDAIVVKTVRNYYLHCANLCDWPANVLYNFCIASRIPIEKPEYLDPWSKGVEIGFDPVLAFLLTWSANGKDFVDPRPFPWMGHLWIDPSADWKRVLSGDMTKMSGSFKEHPTAATPSNCIWGNSKEYKKIMHMSAEKVSALFGLKIEPPAADPPKPAARPNFIKPYKPHGFNYGQGQALANAVQAMQALFNDPIGAPAPIHDEVHIQHQPPIPLIHFDHVNFAQLGQAPAPPLQPLPDPQPEIEDYEPIDWEEDPEPDFD